MEDLVMDNFGKIIFAIVISVFVGCGYGAYISAKEQDRLLNQCMQDGHKEYECVSMLRKPQSSTAFVSTPIVVR